MVVVDQKERRLSTLKRKLANAERHQDWKAYDRFAEAIRQLTIPVEDEFALEFANEGGQCV